MQAASQQTERRDDGEFGQVLQFPQSRAAHPPMPADSFAPEPLDDLARYEEEPEVDYRTRTLTNMIAVVIVTTLIAAGVWIADVIADTARDQDCVMQGRTNCAPLKPAIPSRE